MWGTAEISHWLREVIVLSENWGSIPNTHTAAHNYYHPSYRTSTPLFQLQWTTEPT